MLTSSSIVWLDFRSDDLVRAREFIKSMQDEAVLDELGFLALQGKFSDVFYPATSTQMGPCRYFYFVAAVYKQLERERIPTKDIAPISRKRLDELRKTLAENESTGVIGQLAKERVKLLPSTIHWAGLRYLGMFKAPLSESGYHNKFDEIRTQRRGYSDDDGTALESGVTEYWDSELPSAQFMDEHGKFKPDTCFKLSRQEAKDLAARYSNVFPDSLLTFLLQQKKPAPEFPWAVENPTESLKTHLQHAEALSLFARGVTLQYYQLVVEARKALDLDIENVPIHDEFSKWWAVARRTLEYWKPDELLSLSGFEAVVRRGHSDDLSFIRSWLDYMLSARTSTALFEDAKARELVRKREVQIKPTKARLKHRKHLEQWRVAKVSDATHQFEYRNGIGGRFVSDILEALRGTE